MVASAKKASCYFLSFLGTTWGFHFILELGGNLQAYHFTEMGFCKASVIEHLRVTELPAWAWISGPPSILTTGTANTNCKLENSLHSCMPPYQQLWDERHNSFWARYLFDTHTRPRRFPPQTLNKKSKVSKLLGFGLVHFFAPHLMWRFHSELWWGRRTLKRSSEMKTLESTLRM